jgi:hypothetical protein
MTEPITLKMDKLLLGTQIRCRVSQKTVEEYAASMKDGVEFAPLEGFANTEGLIVIGDGAHRYLARQANEYTSAKVVVHPGKLDQAESLALELSLDRNCRHGLKLSAADKRNAVKMVLSDERMKKLGDRPIAVKVGVSPATVKSVRQEMHAPPPAKDVTVEKHKRRKPQTRNESDQETNPLLERVRTIREWVESGLIEWPDIRQIFATSTHVPTMMPEPPCKVVIVRTGKRRGVSTAEKIEMGQHGDDNAVIITLAEK